MGRRRAQHEGIESSEATDVAAGPQFASTVAHAFAVLQCFSTGEPLLANRDLAERLGFTRPTVSRLTATLVALGYLRRDPRSARYALGPAVLSLGYPLLANLQVRRVAVDGMRELAARSGGPVSLGLRDRTQVVYVETVQGRSANATRPDIGSSRPMLRTAIGRALLHAYEPRDRETLLRRIEREDHGAEATAGADGGRALRDALHASMSELDARGFCIVWGEWRPNLCAVGAPIRSRDGEPYALNLTLPIYATDRSQLERDFGPRLADLASAVSERMGWGG